jgi:predicted ATP-dependent endonuclease of OLD family
MRLVKFRIQNYKSIKDSGWCWLASDLTILAGKNESGKSAILEAIRDFDVDVKRIFEEVFPLDSTEKPVIEMALT